MTEYCEPKVPTTIATTGGGLAPTPSRRINLKTLAQVRREMSHVYREMRAGALESHHGTRFVYVLAQVGKMIEQSELEKRITQLEARHGK
ncbi:hypothetical protein ELE36_09755 [Pseudolysobacter antarcticus]|uniref:Uncharacterized protein n=1 Tax=Pseudolysobacter antarcticus TaxID=2511995 RepID=A0A411HJF5_9GAMM|nr:hypothetical protein [Pseudolysobacter antarcticus]QBB70628.1 hypothetical protein ELE36_09755 [Pseudolysobacter antarcticus]